MRIASFFLSVALLVPQIGVVADEDLTASSSLTSPTPVLPTTLPPAAPGGAGPCDFKNVTDLVARVVEEWAGYNISLLVETCPRVCNMVYGSGNPDISGIGAVSSFAIQGVSSVLFGPVLGVLWLYAGANPKYDSFFGFPAGLWVFKLFAPVARSIHQTNIIIAFSVLFTTLVRTRQFCPVAERNFFLHLVRYEFLIAMICAWSYLPVYESSRLKKAAMIFYVVGTCIMVLIPRDSTGFDVDRHGSALQGITKHCVQQHDWPVPEISLGPSTEFTPSPAVDPATDVADTLGWIFLLVIPNCSPFGLLIGKGIKIIARALFSRMYLGICHRLRVGPRRLGGVFITAAVTSLAVALAWSVFSSLLAQRQKLRTASGSAYQDDEWGFGQIAALLTWIPTAQDLLFTVIRTIRYSRREPPRTLNGLELQNIEPLALRFIQLRLHAGVEARLGTQTPAKVPQFEAMALRYIQFLLRAGIEAKSRARNPTDIPEFEAQILDAIHTVIRSGIEARSMDQDHPEAFEVEALALDSIQSLLRAGMEAKLRARNRTEPHEPEPPAPMEPREPSSADETSLPPMPDDLAHTSSVEVPVPGGTLHARPTWPRNDKGTYLPV